MHRSLLSRGIGLLVAAVALVVAAQWLLLGLEYDPLFDRGRVDDLTDWITGDVRRGAELLVGIAVILAALVVGWTLWQSKGVDRPVITTRRRRGWTKVDRRNLADVIERRLETVDRRSDLEVKLTRRGRVDLRLVTPDPSALGPIQEYRDVIDELATQQHLPIRSGRVVVTVPRRMTARRKVR
jgi:hypothetical protein